MVIVYMSSYLPPPNCIFSLTINSASKNISLSPYSHLPEAFPFSSKNGDLCAPVVDSVSCLPIDVDCLESEFSAPGVNYSSIGNSCVLRMALEDGSLAELMLPSGLITSFKPLMWHGATTELLHTSVSARKKVDAVVQGGLSLALNCKNDAGFSWSPSYIDSSSS